MLYELQDNLGLLDARKCNANFGAELTLDVKSLAKGATVELPPAAATYLTSPKSNGGRGYATLLKPVGKVKGEAKDTELKGPAK